MAGLELFFFYLLGASSSLSLAAINAAQVGLSLFFLWRLVRLRYRPGIPEAALVVFFGWNVVAALFSPYVPDALNGVLNYWSWTALLVGAGLPWAVRKHVKTYAVFLAVSAALTVPMSALTFFIGTDFHNQHLYTKLPMGATAAYGYFSHHLTYAGVMLAAACFLGARAVYGREGKKAGWWAASALAGLGLFFSLARTYYLAAVPSAAVLLWKKGKKWLIGGFLAAAVVGGMAMAFGPASFRQRIENTWNMNNPSNAERIYLWISGFHMWEAHPVAGWGPGIYEQVAGPYKAPYASRIHYPTFTGYLTRSHCHNLYLMIAIQTGAVGLVLFLAFVILAFRGMLKQADPVLKYGAMAAFTAFLFGGLFEFNGGDAEVATLVFFLVGLALNRSGGEDEDGDDDRPAAL